MLAQAFSAFSLGVFACVCVGIYNAVASLCLDPGDFSLAAYVKSQDIAVWCHEINLPQKPVYWSWTELSLAPVSKQHLCYSAVVLTCHFQDRTMNWGLGGSTHVMGSCSALQFIHRAGEKSLHWESLGLL